ncbi:hypothetical protein L9G74_13630 [Shewanella sp. C32]|uniref:Uncharacterized protein n=1 Tax=Shewanella electrica TaxID=515560 RepID=A0ABT2FMB9_9GAMM|nr:hypothetical protein [Shewanella electrica]MCH1927086.1 hypothetical protein [Shewanella electrica]MCS4557487.1 hypothetical protein [Shewanella electrica]
MSITLSALFIFLLIVTGFIFYNTHDKKEGHRLEQKPFEISSAGGVLSSFIFHFIYASAIDNYYKINFKLCISIVTGEKLTSKNIDNLISNSHLIFFYFITSYIIAYVLGKLSQKIRLYLNPYKISAFAYDTPWYYELKGKVSEELSSQIIKVSCLAVIGSESFLYYGYLEDFYLDKTGQLDRIVLSDVYRRNIKNDDKGEKDERFYAIKGARLILKYSIIHNINIEYIEIIEVNDNTE